MIRANSILDLGAKMTERLDPYEIYAEDEWQPTADTIAIVTAAQESDQVNDQYQQAA